MKRGQAFAMDFLLALILVFLSIGLLLRGIELASYDYKEEQLYAELKAVAENAGNMLVAFPEINCRIKQTDVRIMNCIDTNSPMLSLADPRQAFGIPEEYDFNVSNLLQSEVVIGSKQTKDFVEVKRRVLVNNGEITKEAYNTSFRKLQPKEVSIQVWRK